MSTLFEHKKINRFTLEQQLMDCWHVVDDMKVLYSAPDLHKLSEDDYQNALLGLITMYQLKFQNLHNTFEKMVANGQITSNKPSE